MLLTLYHLVPFAMQPSIYFKYKYKLIFRSVTTLDCVRFQSMLSNYSSVDYAHRNSGWLLLDAAETLFNTAKRRLYNSKKGILFIL